MRTMLNPGSQLSNPAERYLRWNGRVDTVKDKSTGAVEKEGGYLYYDDKDNDYETVKLELPFTIYPIGESMSIQGGVYDGANQANNTFLSSSEFGGWDEPIKVYERHIGDTNGAVVARGTWEEIKDTVKAHNGKVRTNLYGVTKIGDKTMIVRLELGGASGRALSDIRRKAGSQFYNAPLIISGVEYKVHGSVDYAVPKFAQGETYTEEAVKAIEEFAKVIAEYGNALRDRNLQNAGKLVITDETSDADYDVAMSQEAVSDDGSQEPVTTEQNDSDNIDLSDLPF